MLRWTTAVGRTTLRYASSAAAPPPPPPPPPNAVQKAMAGILIAMSAAMGALTYRKLHDNDDVVLEPEPIDVADPYPQLRGPFTATTTAGGATVTQDALAGAITLLYFGFAHCPDICPAELTKLATALRRLEATEPELAAHVNIVFATVDPPRDSLDALRTYVATFHPRIAGWTGSDAQMAALARVYKVYVRALSPEEKASDDYVIDHSMFTYLIAPNGNVVELFGADTTPAQIAEAVHRWKPAVL